MTNDRKRALLMKLIEGKWYDERWLLRQGGFTKGELDDLVSEGFFVRIDKEPNDFMSDNRYMLTKSGKAFAWN